MSRDVRIGTAGWSIPRSASPRAPADGTHLQRYAHVLTCTEINSLFHRSHRPAFYAKWVASTPPHFQFAVKLPRTITHDLKLRRPGARLELFLGECTGLGEKLRVLQARGEICLGARPNDSGSGDPLLKLIAPRARQRRNRDDFAQSRMIGVIIEIQP